MKTASKWQTALQIMLAGSLGGVTFQLGGCASAMVNNFNPCGTILQCDNAEFDLLFMDTSVPNYEYNPTCVLPALWNCSEFISGGYTTGTTTGTTGTGTQTTTTTNTNTGTSTRGGNTGTGFGSGFGGFGFGT